jgi:hypothetical protein
VPRISIYIYIPTGDFRHKAEDKGRGGWEVPGKVVAGREETEEARIKEGRRDSERGVKGATGR